MTEPERDSRPEHEEKVEEKEEEKVEEKWGAEKWRRDRVGSATWAAILLWIGVVLLLANLDLVGRYPWWETWAVILSGIGVILLVEILVRAVIPEHRRPVGGNLVLALVLLGVGLSELVSWELVWPALVIAVGLVFLVRGVLLRR